MGDDNRRWIFPVSVAAVFILAALTFFLFARDEPPPHRALPVRESALPKPPSKAELPSESVPPIAADETDLCGYGRVKNSKVADIRKEAGKAADKILLNLKETLALSQYPGESALGLYMQGSTAGLAKLASSNRDPQVYALAFLACRYGREGVCALLSAEQWAEIEPDNGVPWLLVAGFADRDSASRDEAVYRASGAQRFAPHLPDFFGMLQRPELRGQPPQVRSALRDEFMGMHQGLPTILFTPFIQFCSGSSVSYGGRTGACSNLARILLADRTLVGYSAGVKLAELAGWPAEEVKALRAKKVEYQMALIAATWQNRTKARSDCESEAEFDRWAADHSSLGDLGMAAKFIQTAEPDPNTVEGYGPR